MIAIRSLITVGLFLCFIAVWVWAWRSARRADFTAAAHLPLEGDAGAERLEPGCREPGRGDRA